jgi:hypothetical protein
MIISTREKVQNQRLGNGFSSTGRAQKRHIPPTKIGATALSFSSVTRRAVDRLEFEDCPVFNEKNDCFDSSPVGSLGQFLILMS